MPAFVAASDVPVLIRTGAILLDARPAADYLKGHIQNAQSADWLKIYEILRAPQKTRTDPAGKILGNLGISPTSTVIVYGDSRNGWGEDGYLVWLFRRHGHQNTSFVNGGFRALQEYLRTDTLARPAVPTQYDFVGKQPDLTADELLLHLAEWKTLDTREKREYEGATPYGEKRGGHLPGAKHLWYKDLLDQNGYLKSEAEIGRRLSALGIGKTEKVVAYCTGGVRSGWMAVVLQQYGYQVENYHGSMQEWSALAPADFPLIR